MATKIEDSTPATKNAIKEVVGFQPDGSLLAHVTPRVDTVSNLLLVSDAGDGEVATASDIEAQVVYKGDPSQGVQYNRAEIIGSFTFVDSSITIPAAAVPIQLEMDSVVDQKGYVDVGANTFVAGTLVKPASASKGYHMELSIEIKGNIPAATGTYVRVDIERFVTSWIPVTHRLVPILPIAGINPIYELFARIALPLADGPYRIMLSSDESPLIPANVVGSVVYRNLAGAGYSQTK